MIELTCPAEENILSAQIRKSAKYMGLQNLISSSGNWTSQLITIEVGARGYPANSVRHCLKKLGIRKNVAKKAIKALSTTAAKCSYGIFLMRNNQCWQKQDLVYIDV